MSGARRIALWALAVVGGLAAVGLTLVALLTDQDTTNRVIAVTGAITGVATVLIAAATLARTPPPPAPAPAPAPTGGGSVEAGKNAVVVRGSIIGSALGDRSHVTGPPTPPAGGPPPSGSGDVRVGDGGVVAGDIIDSALGDDSRREP